ncbi:hypothetical protein K3555_22345 (plasmid) [Leisingera sp. M527]|uniref:hypothetical protein n=1 Tax=Leisingera sp. M527 TaxID=2867014 RepID=UPI0021A6D55F|nr:hypothetical protein [Leisingera sp. M527]UWQ35410.1 hypothetical protein K3555_22345 [Leisingera sp. M527]
MFTSAQALHQILAAATRHKDSTRFLDAVAQVLELDGEDSDAFAAAHIVKLARDVQKDIRRLPFEATHMEQAQKMFAPFLGLVNYAHVHMDIRNAKGNFLNPQNLLNLTHLHMTMSGHVTREVNLPEAKDLADEFRALRDQVMELKIPEPVRNALYARMSQTIAMLENVYFFGMDSMHDELEALLGAVVLNNTNSKGEDAGFWRKAANAVGRSITAIHQADKTVSAAKLAYDNTEYLLDKLIN